MQGNRIDPFLQFALLMPNSIQEKMIELGGYMFKRWPWLRWLV
jgi:hypothetical protein